ncbi:MAG: hypothetical protein ACI9ES_001661 [Oceanospirillaceae bacterium]
MLSIIEVLMTNLTETVNASFRFFNLNKLQAYTLEREVSGSSKNQHIRNDNYDGSVILENDNLEDIFDFFIRQRIDTSECDILISIAKRIDAEITVVPELVNRMLKFIDCKLTVAHTIARDTK